MVYYLSFSGVDVGIKSVKSDWNLLFGDTCGEMYTYPLFYKHVNSTSSFDDWSTQSFGGWQESQLVGKSYSDDLPLCGDEIVFDYYP